MATVSQKQAGIGQNGVPISIDPSAGALPEYAVPNPFMLLQAPEVLENWQREQLKKSTDVVKPERNPLAEQIYQQNLKRAKDYSAQMPGLSDSLYGKAAVGAQQQLTQDTKQIRSNFNSRGLLNSGQRAGAEYGAKASTDMGLADTRKKINQGLLQNLESLETNAFNSAANLTNPGFQTAQTDLAGVNANMRQSFADSQADADAASSLGGGIGSVAGGGLALAMQRNGQKPGGVSGTTGGAASGGRNQPYAVY